MSTYTVGTAPIEIVRGRPWSLPMHWQDAATPPNAINITDFMITDCHGGDDGELQADARPKSDGECAAGPDREASS
jgi:hypothetical protein